MQPRRIDAIQGAKADKFVIWYPFLDEFRTLCVMPTSELRSVFDSIRGEARGIGQ